MIKDVEVKKLEQFEDDRGWLTEIFRHDESDYRATMSYVSETKPGVARGPHEHKDQSDMFVFLGPGTFKLYLYDNRKDSETYKELQVMEVGEDNPTSIIVPPGVIHGYKCISKDPGWVINLPDKLYKGKGKEEEVDETRWEDRDDCPFKIE